MQIRVGDGFRFLIVILIVIFLFSLRKRLRLGTNNLPRRWNALASELRVVASLRLLDKTGNLGACIR
jgi:hypothetical protein